MLIRKYRMTEPDVVAAQDRLEKLAAAEGLEYHLADSRTCNTMDAHRLVHLGRAHGMQDVVIERLFSAHFTDNRSLFDNESLATLGTEAGLTDVEEFLRGHRYEDAVIADPREAHRLGVRGVPFFLIDAGHGVSGAQSVPVFLDALVRASKSQQRHS